MLMIMIINTNINKLLTCLICVMLLSACSHPASQISEHQLYVFGTLVEINVWHHDDRQTQASIDQISDTFNAMHHQWHAWKPGRLTSINDSLRNGQTVFLNQEEADFLQATISYAQHSNHLFNPAIGELINLWGFHTDDYPLLTPPPAAAEIDHLLNQQLTVDLLKIDGLALSSDNPHIWLDFGGIAKGYAVDRAIQILQHHEINHAIVNAGGDLRSIGNKGETPWRIAIQSPTDWSMVAELLIEKDEAVFTSGNYQRYKEFDGQRYAHIINPKTGMPVVEVVSATVVAATGIHADAAATALVVAGTDGWPAIAKQMNIEQALIINDQMQCYGTQAMIKRLENLSMNCQSVD